VDFIKFQYGRLSDSCKPHIRVLELLAKHKLTYSTDDSSIGYLGRVPRYSTNGRVQEEEEDKDKEEEEDKDKDKGNAPAPALKPVWSPLIGWENVTEELKAEWAAAYPACDIDRQLAAMTAWLRANPLKAHKSNWAKFATNWLSRSQDKGGDAQSNRTDTRNIGTPLRPEDQLKAFNPLSE
jgi:hypothetical protein